MIYAVDLDDTLCVPNKQRDDTYGRYAHAKPIVKNIEYVNKLHDAGHVIKIYTARRMLTHNGNVQAVIDDVGEITRLWLKVNCVKYDELIFGKIYYDFIIDDKAINTETL